MGNTPSRYSPSVDSADKFIGPPTDSEVRRIETRDSEQRGLALAAATGVHGGNDEVAQQQELINRTNDQVGGLRQYLTRSGQL